MNSWSFLRLGSGTDTHRQLEAVSLMTLHAAKGLEFECVFIPGCEKGLLPYSLHKTEVDEEEEKRLLYVGMTRAKILLYLTHARSRTIRGRKFNLPKSPFLQAIQQELIQQIKNKPPKNRRKRIIS
jgi:DNA helicase II / ATP-dependent DNA helicase PcrA